MLRFEKSYGNTENNLIHTKKKRKLISRVTYLLIINLLLGGFIEQNLKNTERILKWEVTISLMDPEVHLIVYKI
jgi:hypothetical protein